MFKINCALLIITLFSVSAMCQSWMYNEPYLLEFKNRHEVSVFAGMATYQGDLHSFSDENLSLTSELNTAIGLMYTLNINNPISVGLSYFTTKLSGDDGKSSEYWHKKRDFSFTNRIHEFALRVDYEPFQLQNSKFMPYIFGGVGIIAGNAKTDFESKKNNDSWKNIIDQDIQNKKNTSLSIPLGIGLRYYLTSNISIKLEGSIRVGMNDYLDGVSVGGHPASDSFGAAGLSFVYGFGQSPAKEKVIKVKPADTLSN